MLLADDDEAVRLVERRALLPITEHFLDAADGRSALELCFARHPDLVLLDLGMPKLDGFAVLERLRTEPAFEDLPVIVVTGDDRPETIEKAYDAGATDFLLKPFHPVVIVQRVRFVLRASEALLRVKATERRLATAQRIANLGHWQYEEASHRFVLSTEVRRILGLDRGVQSVGEDELLARVHAHDRERLRGALATTLGRARALSIEHRIETARGVRTVQLHGEVVLDERGQAIGIEGTVQDVSERKAVERRIQHLAFQDSLTGLMNRRMFQDQLAGVLAAARRHRRVVALMFLDLDQFKRINDTLGHGIGDALLRQVARRLTDVLRRSDAVGRPADDSIGLVSRFGGDEFTVLLTDLEDPLAAATVARRILASLQEPFHLPGRDVLVTASIGITLAPTDGSHAEELLRNADAAMYHAKASGRAVYRFYDPSMNAMTERRVTLEQGLRHALDRDELQLAWQPIVDGRSGRLVAAEALVRWTSPELGPVGPAELIPLAEETGLIVRLGEWVIGRALEQWRAWRGELPTATRLSVNVSGAQLVLDEFAEQLAGLIRLHDLDPHDLVLEITERVLVEHQSAVSATMRAIANLGVSFALDDFGTGYSSLAYLRRYPVSCVKIDRSFVHDLATGSDGFAIVSAVVSMARALGLRVVAEGVETPEQRSLLVERGCTELQGHLFGEPVAAADFARFFTARFDVA